jgi:hypothetical protein
MVHKRGFVLQCDFTWCLWWKAMYDWNVFVTWKTDILQTNNVDLKIINGPHCGFCRYEMNSHNTCYGKRGQTVLVTLKLNVEQTNNVDLKIINCPHTVFCILWILKILVMKNEDRLYCVCDLKKCTSRLLLDINLSSCTMLIQITILKLQNRTFQRYLRNKIFDLL